MMNQQQAIEAAQQIGVAPGDYITMQSEGQINNPHLPTPGRRPVSPTSMRGVSPTSTDSCRRRSSTAADTRLAPSSEVEPCPPRGVGLNLVLM